MLVFLNILFLLSCQLHDTEKHTNRQSTLIYEVYIGYIMNCAATILTTCRTKETLKEKMLLCIVFPFIGANFNYFQSRPHLRLDMSSRKSKKKKKKKGTAVVLVVVALLFYVSPR